MSTSVGVLIPTYQAANHLQFCLPPLIASSCNPRILVIDSSSTDQTASIAKEYGIEVLIIPQREFNHGTTREMGRKYLKTEIVVMITQDAYASSPDMLEMLIQPLIEKKASIAYARQLPHPSASVLASFSREFNYPVQSHVRSLADKDLYGSYTFFCSNSCAAYRYEALEEIGGFTHTLFGEDTEAVAKLLHADHKIAYVAEAKVHHSHEFTLKQEFSRHFDMGFARSQLKDLLEIAGKDKKRGQLYTKELMKRLWKNNPKLIPYATIQTILKFCGYSIGRRTAQAPVWLKQFLSGQKEYWGNTK